MAGPGREWVTSRVQSRKRARAVVGCSLVAVPVPALAAFALGSLNEDVAISAWFVVIATALSLGIAILMVLLALSMFLPGIAQREAFRLASGAAVAGWCLGVVGLLFWFLSTVPLD